MTAKLDDEIGEPPADNTDRKPSIPPWKAIFGFTAYRHVLILIPALCCSAISGAAVPVQSYLVGQVFQSFTQFASGTRDVSSFKHILSKYIVYTAFVATAHGLASMTSFFCFHVFGDLQARSAREKIFATLLHRNIGWFDTRQDGINALSTRLFS